MAKTKKETHYQYRRMADGSWQAIKMSPQGETLDVYKLTSTGGQCSCPAHVHCRHQIMLKVFLTEARFNTGWSYCYETETWHAPKVINKPGGLYADMFDDLSQPDATPHLIDM